MKTLISKNRPSHTGLDFFRAATASVSAISKFEKSFAAHVGTAEAIAFPYCRVAIEALLEVATQPGQKVVLPAYTCSVVAHAVAEADRTPRFVDISLDDFNAPVSDLLAATDAQTGAIIPTHMYGNPVPMDPLNTLSRPMLIIEDASLSMHRAWKSTNPNITTATVYSLGSNKIISTIRGGVVASDDNVLMEKLRQWQTAHLEPNTTADYLVLIAQLAVLTAAFGPRTYSFIDRLRGSRLFGHYLDTRSLDSGGFPHDATKQFSPVQAALGLQQLPRVPAFLERRREIAERYTAAFSNQKNLVPMTILNDSHLSHYALRVPDRDAKQVREKLRLAGIESGVTFDYLVPELPLYRGYATQSYPHGSRIVQELVNLPNYPALTDQQVEDIIQATLKATETT